MRVVTISSHRLKVYFWQIKCMRWIVSENISNITCVPFALPGWWLFGCFSPSYFDVFITYQHFHVYLQLEHQCHHSVCLWYEHNTTLHCIFSDDIVRYGLIEAWRYFICWLVLDIFGSAEFQHGVCRSDTCKFHVSYWKYGTPLIPC